MKSFSYIQADSLDRASQLLLPDGQSRLLAGGTDLLTQIKSGVIGPERLISLKKLSGLDGIHFNTRNGLVIGALATLDNIARNAAVKEHYPLLDQAIAVAASPQLRNRGTIGGNLVQASRCWYYRGDFKCWLKGGLMCYARNGENEHHAIFGGGPCYTVNPSDPVPALIALQASVRIHGRDGERTLPLEELFQSPNAGSRQLTVLIPGDIIKEIILPVPGSNVHGLFLKAMERRVWAFALVSLAVQISFQDRLIDSARIILGGVAPKPWRSVEVERYLSGRGLDIEVIEQSANLAVNGAQPLSRNGYKIPLIKGLLKQSLITLRSETA